MKSSIKSKWVLWRECKEVPSLPSWVTRGKTGAAWRGYSLLKEAVNYLIDSWAAVGSRLCSLLSADVPISAENVCPQSSSLCL